MSFLRSDAALDALVITKGHPFARDPFFAMFEALPDVAATAVEQPAAQAFFATDLARAYDAFVFYDMPGLDFSQGPPARPVEPPEQTKRDLEALVEAGQGLVFLHHAIAAWPSWPEYGRLVGARFLYQPGEVHGVSLPDSGYRHDVQHRLTPVAAGHPVLAGLEAGFEIRDELYLCPIFEDAVTPLLRSDASFESEHFYSSAQAVAGRMHSREGWAHPPGSNLIAWTHVVGRSPIVTILCGDGPEAYACPELRLLIHNAIRFVAGEAKALRAA
jgi:type 1 glutamine amidotransferase